MINFSDKETPYILPEVQFGDSMNLNVVQQPIYFSVFKPNVKTEELIIL